MEDVFENTGGQGSSLLPQTTDVLLKCTDGLRQHVADLRGGGRGSDHFGPLVRDLLAAQPAPAGSLTPAHGMAEGLQERGRPRSKSRPGSG